MVIDVEISKPFRDFLVASGRIVGSGDRDASNDIAVWVLPKPIELCDKLRREAGLLCAFQGGRVLR